MDFEKVLQDDMDDVAKKVEAGLEKIDMKDAITAEEVENIVRSVVKEELAIAVKDIKKYINNIISENLNKASSNVSRQESVSGNVIEPNIEYNKKVSYNVKAEARYKGMTCGGWTFFDNDKEGRHLWAVNEDGTKYYELYPKTISMVTKVEDGYVYFTDADYKDFRVCISDGKIEKVKGY